MEPLFLPDAHDLRLWRKYLVRRIGVYADFDRAIASVRTRFDVVRRGQPDARYWVFWVPRITHEL